MLHFGWSSLILCVPSWSLQISGCWQVFCSLLFCESLRILAMSRQTCHSWDTGLFPDVNLAVFPEFSFQSSQPAASINPAISSMASQLPAAQPSPDCLVMIVQVVRTSIAASIAGESTGSSPASIAVVGTSCSLLLVPGGVHGQDLGCEASALLASGTSLLLQLSLASTSFSQGRPAFVFPSFISTFAPPNPMLVSSWVSAVAAFSAQSGVPTSFPANLAPILHQPFVVGPGFSSPRWCLQNLWSLMSCCLSTLRSQSLNSSCCLMGA